MSKKYSTVTYEIEIVQDEQPVDGHFATDEPDADREMEREIVGRLERGDVWAWCCVRVKAIADNGDEAFSSWLGACSYKDEADFRDDSGEGYFTDMCNEAHEQLCKVEQSHRQGIQTRYCEPTNSRGARVKVWAQAGVRYVSWDHALNADENHAAAARQFAREWSWTGRWIGGAMPDGRGYLFVNVKG